MSASKPGSWSPLDRLRTSSTVVIVAALVIGAVVVPAAYGAGQDLAGPDGQVAVIDVPSLLSEQTTGSVIEHLEMARHNESIDAVVLDVNTPGGGVGATEELFLEVERTAEQLPVAVHTSEMAASGGYYISAPADRIFANPSAQVGSVGIRMSVISSTGPSGQITSGPDKAGGTSRERAIEQAEFLVQGFYGAVLEHRGDELELSKTELAHAKVYFSQQAVHLGLIDEIGTSATAEQWAAEQAGLGSYDVVELESEQPMGVVLFGEGEDRRATPSAARLLDPAPGVETTVPLALHGRLPGERPVVTTAGDGVTTVATQEVSSDG
jgi:protease-4